MPTCKSCNTIQQVDDIVRRDGRCLGCGEHCCVGCGCTARAPCRRITPPTASGEPGLATGEIRLCAWAINAPSPECDFCYAQRAEQLYREVTKSG